MTDKSSASPSGRKVQQITRIADFLKAHMTLHGYELAEVPIIEQADLFLTKAGDRIAEQLFTFERHGQILALRPEFTASAAHLFSTRERSQLPVRWQFFGPIFIDTHGGQRYEQYSCGAELLGMDHPIADSEIITMAVRALVQQNITDWNLYVGHVGLTRILLDSFGIDTRTMRFMLHHRHRLLEGDSGRSNLLEELARYIPRSQPLTDAKTMPMSETGTQGVLDALLNTTRSSETMGGRTRHDIAKRLIQKQQQTGQDKQILDALGFLEEWMSICESPARALPAIERHLKNTIDSRVIFTRWKQVLDLLDGDTSITNRTLIQPDLARNWDYYTGLVFEIRAPDGTALVGGGRYDDLTRLLGADRSVPAVGLAFDVAAMAKNLPDSVQDSMNTPVQIVINPLNLIATTQWADLLRKHKIAAALVERADPGRSSIIIQTNGEATTKAHAYTMDSVQDLIRTLKGNHPTNA